MPKSRNIEQNFTKNCYKWLVQPGSNFSICSVIFLRLRKLQIEFHPAANTPQNDFYTKQIQTAFTPENQKGVCTRIPCRCSTDCISFLTRNLTFAHRTKHYPLESFLFNVLTHIFFCFSSGNKSTWDRSKEQSTLVTMPRKFSTDDYNVIPLTRLWLQKKSCSTKKKHIHRNLTSFSAHHVAPFPEKLPGPKDPQNLLPTCQFKADFPPLSLSLPGIMVCHSPSDPFFSPTVGGSEIPNNHLGCIKPCK